MGGVWLEDSHETFCSGSHYNYLNIMPLVAADNDNLKKQQQGTCIWGKGKTVESEMQGREHRFCTEWLWFWTPAEALANWE